MTEIQNLLFAARDPGYREFHARLMPTIDLERIIGVRIPSLRRMAKELAGTTPAAAFLEALPHEYYEENNLHGFLIGELRDFSACLAQVERFLPYVDNWATCDSLRPKCFGKHKQELLPHIQRWLAAGEPYTVRFAMEMLMVHFLDGDFSPAYPDWVAAVESSEYYVNMMAAWYFATALAKQWEAVIPYLEQNRLAPWVHNKTIQKAVESYRITGEQKEYLRKLRR
ncbi:MAG: DNA alkylation repair protein [Eubacteriales bacterium]|nr:DNA alkylation repair protein [Eubacteriales bacterium]